MKEINSTLLFMSANRENKNSTEFCQKKLSSSLSKDCGTNSACMKIKREAKPNRQPKGKLMKDSFRNSPPGLSLKPENKEEARLFADNLLSRYIKKRESTPNVRSVCVEFTDDYPEESVLEHSAALLSGIYEIEGREFSANSGRAGCIWVTPKFTRA